MLQEADYCLRTRTRESVKRLHKPMLLIILTSGRGKGLSKWFLALIPQTFGLIALALRKSLTRY